MPKITKFDSGYHPGEKHHREGKKQARYVWEKHIKPLLFEQALDDDGKPMRDKHNKRVYKTTPDADGTPQLIPKLDKSGKPICVGVIYSANNNQAKALYATYLTGESTKISGGGQAVLFGNLEKMIQKQGLEQRVRILPVATSLDPGGNDIGNHVDLEIIKLALKNIAYHIGRGFNVLAVKETADEEHFGLYSVGGMTSSNWYKKDKIWFVEDAEGKLHLQTSKSKHRAAKDQRISQGDYVQKQLKMLAHQPVEEWPEYLREAYELGKKGEPAPWIGDGGKEKLKPYKHESPDETSRPKKSTGKDQDIAREGRIFRLKQAAINKLIIILVKERKAIKFFRFILPKDMIPVNDAKVKALTDLSQAKDLADLKKRAEKYKDDKKVMYAKRSSRTRDIIDSLTSDKTSTKTHKK